MKRILLVGNYPADRQYSMLRYTQWLAGALRAEGWEVLIVHPRIRLGYLSGSSASLRKWIGYVDKFLIFPIRLLSVARNFDLVHICDHSNAPYELFLRRRRVVVTCHDLIAIKAALGHSEGPKTRWSGRILQDWILSSLKRIRYVSCVSRPTADDVARLVGSDGREIRYIPNPCFGYSPMAPDEAARVLNDAGISARGPFILHVGGNSWYKNRRGVVEIFRHLAQRPGFSNFNLVLAGPELEPELWTEIASSRAAGQILRIADPSEGVLRALYSRAAALLFPSLEEGFGWPILEAQACGCSVITSRREPMMTVGGKAAFYIDPLFPEAAAEEIESNWQWILSQKVESIKNAGRFSEKEIVNQYLALYNFVLRS